MGEDKWREEVTQSLKDIKEILAGDLRQPDDLGVVRTLAQLVRDVHGDAKTGEKGLSRRISFLEKYAWMALGGIAVIEFGFKLWDSAGHK